MFAVLNRCRQLNREEGNRGFTMVEALVSMLILGLLVTPLLLNFRVAFNTNLNASVEAYAQDYGQQVIETLKSYGASAVDGQFRGEKTFDITETASGASTGVADTSFRIQSSPDEFSSGDIRRYVVLGGTDGGRAYDVQITYDPTEYSMTETDENGRIVGAGATSFDINSYPDASVFSDASTVVIDPGSTYMVYDTHSGNYVYDTDNDRYAGSRSTSYEEIALNGYYSTYVAMYQRMCESMNDVMTTDKYNLPSDYFISASDLGIYSQSKAKSTIAKTLKRRTGILVDGKMGDLEVRSSLLFNLDVNDFRSCFGTESSMEAAIRDHLSGNLLRNDGEYLGSSLKETLVNDMYRAASAELSSFIAENQGGLTLQYTICHSTSMDDLERIYLMYDPLLLSKWAKNDDLICVYINDGGTGAESILKKFRDRELELYIVPQTGLAKMESGVRELQSTNYVTPKLNFCRVEYDDQQHMAVDLSDKWSGFSNTVHVNYISGYLNLTGSGVADGSGGDPRSVVATTDPDIAVIYRVTVSVFEHSDDPSGAFEGKPLATLEGSFG